MRKIICQMNGKNGFFHKVMNFILKIINKLLKNKCKKHNFVFLLKVDTPDYTLDKYKCNICSERKEIFHFKNQKKKCCQNIKDDIICLECYRKNKWNKVKKI